jgi:hypothetical protein
MHQQADDIDEMGGGFQKFGVDREGTGLKRVHGLDLH